MYIIIIIFLKTLKQFSCLCNIQCSNIKNECIFKRSYHLKSSFSVTLERKQLPVNTVKPKHWRHSVTQQKQQPSPTWITVSVLNPFGLQLLEYIISGGRLHFWVSLCTRLVYRSGDVSTQTSISSVHWQSNLQKNPFCKPALTLEQLQKGNCVKTKSQQIGKWIEVYFKA